MGILVNAIKKYEKRKEMKMPPYYCFQYKVCGRNPKSGRKKTVYVVAASNASELDITSRSGLLPPFEVVPAQEMPTEAQLELIREKKIKIPADASSVDASLFISRFFDNSPVQPPAPIQFIDFAIKNGVLLPKYAGRDEARELLLNALPEMATDIKTL